MVQTLGCGPTVGSLPSSSAPPFFGRGRIVPPPPPRSSRTIFSISRILFVVFDMVKVVNFHHLQHQSGLHEIFCAIQNRGFLTCILCRKLPSKFKFYQKFQANSLLSFRVKHFSAAATVLLATMSNLQLLHAKVFSDAQKTCTCFQRQGT